MRRYFYFIPVILLSCNSPESQSKVLVKTAKNNRPDTVLSKKDVPVKKEEPIPGSASASKVYSNARFKEVTAEKKGEHVFLVKGKAQVFEAAFSWVVEDGHNEIKKGFQMTDAGAPEWGNFSFTVDVKKVRENSTIHLILFEASAKDGSRQYELPILLY